MAAIEAGGAWHHFIDRIWFDQRDAVTTAWFDPDWYLARYPAAAQRVRRRISVCALQDYLTAGLVAGASPVPQFDEGFYLGANADAADGARAGRFSSGYDYFLRVGARERRQPAAHIDLRRYHDETPAARIAIATTAARDAYTHLLLSGGTTPLPGNAPEGKQLVAGGHVDSHGFATVAGGWGFLGWVPGGVLPGSTTGTTEVRATARFVAGERGGAATLVRFARGDLPGGGAGMLLFLPGQGPEDTGLGGLVEVEIEAGDAVARLPAAVGSPALDEPTLVTHGSASIAVLGAGDAALARLRVLRARRPYAGASTLTGLQDPVFFQIDETILCPNPDGLSGLAFNGWMLTTPGTVVEVRLHAGGRSAVLALDHVPRPERPDALEGIGNKSGLATLRSGFITCAEDILAEGEVPYIAITTARGEIGYQPVPPPRLLGMEAMRYLLDRAEPRYGEVGPAFGQVFGPAIARLNADRLRPAPEFRTIDFGQPPALPRISVIVTLHRRLDFLE